MKKTVSSLLIFSLLLSIISLAQNLQTDLAFTVLPYTKSNNSLFPKSAYVDYETEVSFKELELFIKDKKATKAVLGYTNNQRPIEVYYFPGTSNKKALVIGGMHGSELSSVEIARTMIQLLQKKDTPYYNVLVIPSLFPDNAACAQQLSKKQLTNAGRYTNEISADPNRQMPPLGKGFNVQQPVDLIGRPIERENQLLLQLIAEYKPTRIANLHAIRDVARAGVYADPRTDCNGLSLGFESDSSLAIAVAKKIYKNGGKVPGNKIWEEPTARYYNDPCIAPAGAVQPRNLHGSLLPNHRGDGVSLGGWATTAVCDENNQREAIRVLTIEFPGYKLPESYLAKEDKEICSTNIRLYAEAVSTVFLSALCEE